MTVNTNGGGHHLPDPTTATLRMPQGRPDHLTPGDTWPCGRCDQLVDALAAHRCAPVAAQP